MFYTHRSSEFIATCAQTAVALGSVQIQTIVSVDQCFAWVVICNENRRMFPSIPVSEFVNPARGSSAFNAIARALEIRPTIDLIGTFDNERYYRAQSKGRPPHCVIVTTDSETGDEAKCDCPSHYIPQEPRACLHIAAVLMFIANQKE